MNALEYTKELIAITSPSGEERAITEYIKSIIVPFGTVYKTNCSLALHIKGKNTKKAFILNGHTDTVPASNTWSHDPYVPIEKNGKLYGLGASDMKSGVGIMLTLAEYYAANQPPCDMWYMFVEKEEIDGSGTKALLDYIPDLTATYPGGVEGVILEPTDARTIGIGHKGNVFVTLTFEGEGGHGSAVKPYNQRAAHNAATFVTAIPQIGDAWQKNYSDRVLGLPTINVTDLQSSGSPALNAIPEAVTVTLDIRTTPQLGRVLSQELKAIAKKYTCTYSYPYNPSGYGLCPENSVLLKIARKEFAADSILVFQGATDQLFFTEKNIPMLIYGPGCNAVMHQPDEYVEISAIETCLNTIKAIYTQYTAHS